MNRKHTTESVRKLVEAEGYTLMSEYERYNKQITVMCPEGHTYPVYLGNFPRYKCGYCAGTRPFTYKYVKEFIESKGYTLVSTDYSRTHDLLTLICPSGHEYTVTFNSFKRGTRCSRCSASRGEHLVREILKGILVDKEFKEQYKVTENGCNYYYDFIVEGVPNILIEYDGIQHFEARDLFGGYEALKENQQRDRIKDELAQSLGDILIRVPYHLSNVEVHSLLVEKMAPYVRVNTDWEFSIDEYNPVGYDYKAIADYYKEHSLADTASKFSISNSFPSACFIKVYGMTKKEYTRRN